MSLFRKSLSVGLFVTCCWKSTIWFSSSTVHYGIYWFIHHPAGSLVVHAYGLSLNLSSIQSSKVHWRKSFLCFYRGNSMRLFKIICLGSSHRSGFFWGSLVLFLPLVLPEKQSSFSIILSKAYCLWCVFFLLSSRTSHLKFKS